MIKIRIYIVERSRRVYFKKYIVLYIFLLSNKNYTNISIFSGMAINKLHFARITHNSKQLTTCMCSDLHVVPMAVSVRDVIVLFSRELNYFISPG